MVTFTLTHGLGSVEIRSEMLYPTQWLVTQLPVFSIRPIANTNNGPIAASPMPVAIWSPLQFVAPQPSVTMMSEAPTALLITLRIRAETTKPRQE